MSPPLDPSPFLTTRSLARSVEVHEVLDSTNGLAKARAREGAEGGLAIVALAQTAGRGQRDRTWHSPPGAGLYVSFLLRPRLAGTRAPLLPLLSGVAAREASSSFTRTPLGLKWPNDLLVAAEPWRGRKLGGVLVEVSALEDRIDYAVIGVGLNLVTVARPEAIRSTAVALDALEVSTELPTLPRVLAAVANALEAWVDRLTAEGPQPLLEAWTASALGLNEEVEFVEAQGRRRGILLGLAPDGALRLRTTEGDRALYNGQLHLPGCPRP